LSNRKNRQDKRLESCDQKQDGGTFDGGKLILFLIILQPINDEKSVKEDKRAVKPDIFLEKRI